MLLKIVKIEPKLAGLCLIAGALLCITAAWFFVKWNFANVIASHIDAERSESKLIADWLTQVAPSDPQTHFAAALIFEKTFNADDLARSLSEYETAVALSPYNFVMWLDLGKARSMNGDADGAEMAYARALELAPNYASVQWAYGNLLIRQGKVDEGFALIAKAAVSNPDYSRSATVTALQIFDGDLVQVRRSLGDSDVTNAALSAALASGSRYDEAYEAWSKIAADDKTAKFKKIGEALTGQVVSAKKFQLAALIVASLESDEAGKPAIGQIGNGGFENGVKLRNAGLFEWQIADGSEPQIGLNEGQKHLGRYSLFMLFNTFETAGFRSVSQTVAVVPGAAYQFKMFYKSDVKTSATFKWEINDAVTAAPIASTSPFFPAVDWTQIETTFKVPPGGDGIVVRFVREGCNGPSCPTSGKIFFDDIELVKVVE